jgi:hypothetical protein
VIFTLQSKYLPHLHSGSALYLLVEIQEWSSQRFGSRFADRRFTNPGQTDENEMRRKS